MTFDNSSFDRNVDRAAVVLLILCFVIAFFVYSGRVAFSIATGGFLSAINFHWLKRAVDFVILEGATGPVGKRVAWQYVGRYALIALTLYVTIHFSLLIPAVIVAGLLVYVLAILLVSVFEIGKAWKNISS